MKRINLRDIRQMLVCFVLACLTSGSNLAAVNSGKPSYLATKSSLHSCLFDLFLLKPPLSSARPGAPVASIYVVNSTLDTADATPGNNVCADSAGQCTLRAAIEEANAHAGADTIAFTVASGLQTINAGSGFPTITEPITIDATTQPGYLGRPLI